MTLKESGLTGPQSLLALQNFWIRKAKLALTVARQSGLRPAVKALFACDGQISEMIRRSPDAHRQSLVRDALAVFNAAHLAGQLNTYRLAPRQHIIISFAALADRPPLVAAAGQAWQRAYQEGLVSFKYMTLNVSELELFAGVNTVECYRASPDEKKNYRPTPMRASEVYRAP